MPEWAQLYEWFREPVLGYPQFEPLGSSGIVDTCG